MKLKKIRKIFNWIVNIISVIAIAFIVIGAYRLGTMVLIEQELLKQQVRVLGHQLDYYEKSNHKLMKQQVELIKVLAENDYLLTGLIEEEIEKVYKVIETQTQEPDYNLIIKATVTIINYDKGIMGSGVCINYKGRQYILSAFHLDESEEIYVIDGGREVRLKLLLSDERNDLILFTMEEELNTVKYVDFVDTEINVGDKVFPAGNPMGIEDAITSGIVVRKSHNRTKFLVDAPVWFGNSGGAVWNKKTQIVGISSQILCGVNPIVGLSQCYGLIIDIDVIESFLGQLI